jgi:hypothetical protein
MIFSEKESISNLVLSGVVEKELLKYFTLFFSATNSKRCSKFLKSLIASKLFSVSRSRVSASFKQAPIFSWLYKPFS